ncbi:MAG: GAF domain-containing protein [Burkholderiales bacterium]|nr:GAF domain-containing protein [Burkholderiales bacterium]
MRQISWISDLHRFGLEAVESGDVTVFYGRILKHVVEGFQAKSGCFGLLEEDGLMVVAGIDLPEEVIGSRVEDGVMGWVVKNGQPLLLQGDVSEDPRFSFSVEKKRREQGFSSICWPLVDRNSVIGCISVNRSPGMAPFSEEDLAHGSALLDLVSLALGNVRMHIERKGRLEELQLLNKRIEDAQNQLLQSEKMASIGQLAAGVAHEINNPIGYVNSNLGTLQRHISDIFTVLSAYEAGVSEENVKELAERLEIDYIRTDILELLNESQEGIARVRKIVQDLKDFSHVDEAEWQFADLHRGLESTLNIVHNELKYKATVVKEYGRIPEVECLPSQLNQVFMNILVNAAHAIKESGIIKVRTGVSDGEVWVEISDTGQGIPKENLGRIFAPFFTTKPVGKGTGLGLSLSYSIMQKHEGRIEVESEIGKGTTFRVILPVRQKEAKAA